MTLITIFETTNALLALNTSDGNTQLVLAALIPGVIALVLSIINALRIKRIKKLHEVDLINHREDINLSMEGIKVTLAKEIKNLKKGANRTQRGHKQKQKPDRNAPNEPKSEDENKKKVVHKRPQQRSKNYRNKPKPNQGNQQENRQNKENN